MGAGDPAMHVSPTALVVVVPTETGFRIVAGRMDKGGAKWHVEHGEMKMDMTDIHAVRNLRNLLHLLSEGTVGKLMGYLYEWYADELSRHTTDSLTTLWKWLYPPKKV